MKIIKITDDGILRIKVADGVVDDEKFTVSVLIDGSGVLIEFEEEKYLAPTEEIIKEVVKTRNE